MLQAPQKNFVSTIKLREMNAMSKLTFGYRVVFSPNTPSVAVAGVAEIATGQNSNPEDTKISVGGVPWQPETAIDFSVDVSVKRTMTASDGSRS